jgi:hypothetical protein
VSVADRKMFYINIYTGGTDITRREKLASTLVIQNLSVPGETKKDLVKSLKHD